MLIIASPNQFLLLHCSLLRLTYENYRRRRCLVAFIKAAVAIERQGSPFQK